MNCFVKLTHIGKGIIRWNIVDDQGDILIPQMMYEDAVLEAENLEEKGINFAGWIVDQPTLLEFSDKETFKAAMRASALNPSEIQELIEDTIQDVEKGALQIGPSDLVFTKEASGAIRQVVEDVHPDYVIPGPNYPFTTIGQMKKHRSLHNTIVNLRGKMSSDFADNEPIPILSILDNFGFESAISCLSLYHHLSPLRHFVADCIYHTLSQRNPASKEEALEYLERAYEIADGRAALTFEEIGSALIKGGSAKRQQEIEQAIRDARANVLKKDNLFNIIIYNESLLLSIPGIMFIQPVWGVITTIRSLTSFNSEKEWQEEQLKKCLLDYMDREDGQPYQKV